jgi:HEPN domain
MPFDSKRIADTRAWLSKAAFDLRAAEYERGAPVSLAADIAFHAQQAVEKVLKAFLTWHDRPFRKIHNLIEIGGQCAALDPELGTIITPCGPADGVRLEVPLSRRGRRAHTRRGGGGLRDGL